MEENLVTQEWLDAHPDSTLKIGDAIPTDTAVATGPAADLPPEVAAIVPPTHEVPEVAPIPDLEKERDDRVIPVAQGVLEDMAGQSATVNVNNRSEFTNTIVSILKRSLAADLNVTTDNPYIFQLVLGAFGAFNNVVMDSKMADMQDERYSKIAHEMMLLLASAKVPMGMRVKSEEQIAALQSIKPQLEEIFAREMLSKLEVTYILEGLLNALKVTHQVYQQNIEDSIKRMEAKVLKIDDMNDLTMKKFDWALSTNIEEILKESESEQQA